MASFLFAFFVCIFNGSRSKVYCLLNTEVLGKLET